MCGLITREQADSLVGGGAEADKDQYACSWDEPDKKMLTIKAEASHPYGTHSGPDVAHGAYAEQRSTDSASSSAEHGFAGDVSGVGDEAYALDDRTDGSAQIVFRTSNLVVTVEYTTNFIISQTATEDGAVRAAKWIVAALARTA